MSVQVLSEPFLLVGGSDGFPLNSSFPGFLVDPDDGISSGFVGFDSGLLNLCFVFLILPILHAIWVSPTATEGSRAFSARPNKKNAWRYLNYICTVHQEYGLCQHRPIEALES